MKKNTLIIAFRGTSHWTDWFYNFQNWDDDFSNEYKLEKTCNKCLLWGIIFPWSAPDLANVGVSEATEPIVGTKDIDVRVSAGFADKYRKVRKQLHKKLYKLLCMVMKSKRGGA